MATLINKPVTRETHATVAMVGTKQRPIIVTLEKSHLVLREKGTRQPPVYVSYDKLYVSEVNKAARGRVGL
jgi:hypothetical protein